MCNMCKREQGFYQIPDVQPDAPTCTLCGSTNLNRFYECEECGYDSSDFYEAH